VKHSFSICEILIITGIFNTINDLVTVLSSEANPRKTIKGKDIDLLFDEIYPKKCKNIIEYPCKYTQRSSNYIMVEAEEAEEEEREKPNKLKQ